ncbi:unnamed protein product [Macrosiphum euphorbiae]|uniref:MYND-type domain-containing protein n=1 Tax=Macrosiphum euphorbiae TaxID=13131 RepID=A0AAV0WLK2_9HEMI|nr:unnamed protein product [Macrosiphum euphorbiae]
MAKYVKKVGGRPYQNYSEETLKKAVMELKTKKITFRDAEKKYRISKSTLQRKVNNKNTMKVGRPNTLSEKDEENLVKGICLSSKWGFPFTSMDIRHKSILSERLAENIKRSRAEINHESIKKYFEHLKNSLAGVSANLIINYDETNITDDPGKAKIITRRGCKHPERILDSSKSSVSVMFAGTASGYLLPPYVCHMENCASYVEIICNKCKLARYCSVLCQKRHWWLTHSFECHLMNEKM